MSQGRYPEIEKELIHQRAAQLRRQAANERAVKGMGPSEGGLRRLGQLMLSAIRGAARWAHASQRSAQARSSASHEERQEPRFGR